MSEGTWLDRFDARMNAVRAYVAQRGPGPSLELLGTLRQAEGAIAGFADHVEHDLGRARDAISDFIERQAIEPERLADLADGRATVRLVPAGSALCLADDDASPVALIPHEPELPESVQDMISELHRQRDTRGRQDHGIFRWLAIAGEEFGEAAQAALAASDTDPGQAVLAGHDVYLELIQVAAVCVSAAASVRRAALGGGAL